MAFSLNFVELGWTSLTRLVSIQLKFVTTSTDLNFMESIVLAGVFIICQARTKQDLSHLNTAFTPKS